MNDHRLRQDSFNPSMQFIRPSTPVVVNRSQALRQYENADPLGITYKNTKDNKQNDNVESHEADSSDLFRELNFPHVKPATPVSIITQRRTSEGGILPLLSSSPSPSSSCSSAATSPLLRNTLRRDSFRTKCQLTRRASNTSPQSASLSAKSWNHLQSPAASFLSAFAAQDNTPSPHLPEETGDKIGDYVLDKIIGTGGFSTVRLASRISDGCKVAIKIMRKSNLSESELLHLERELDIWQRLDHRNIVRFHEILETDVAIYVVCDYCPNNLLDYVNSTPLTEQEARDLFLQLCCALTYLHDDRKMCHKDLKLENVLFVQENGGKTIKLCDFGFAVYQSATADQMDEFAGGSLAYASPEQIRSEKPLTCPKTDVWSLGVILYTLTARRLPFSDEFVPRLQAKILAGVFEMPSQASAPLQELIKGCLSVDPAQRYSLAEVLDSSWCLREQ